MDHLLNWIEIPVTDMKRAINFYHELLKTDLHEMKLAPNDWALFAVKDDSGCLVKGDGYVPRTDGVVLYLNGGQDLSGALGRVEKSGGKVLLKKTFLSEEAGHIAYFKRHGGQQIGLHSMN